MSRHVVIGKGKLGVSLCDELLRRNEQVSLLSRSTGFFWPNPAGVDPVINHEPDYVWCAVGAGSVSECEEDYESALSLHVSLPTELLRKCHKDTKIILFSTDYVANEGHPSDPNKSSQSPRSMYAISKLTMEHHFLGIGRENSACIRIGNLYSWEYFPELSFPGKLINNHPKPCYVSLPTNRVTPTPCHWLAGYLVENLKKIFSFKTRIHHVAPSGFTYVHDWGKEILGSKWDVKGGDVDQSRPVVSELGCSLGETPHWKELWETYGAGFTEFTRQISSANYL